MKFHRLFIATYEVGVVRKPGSVSVCPFWADFDSHFSNPDITARLKRPTCPSAGHLNGASWFCFGWGLPCL